MSDSRNPDLDNVDSEWHLRDYYDLMIRNIALILATFAIVMAVTLIHTFLQKPRYSASATLILEVTGSSLGTPSPRYAFSFDGQAERKTTLEFYLAFFSSYHFQQQLVAAVQADSLMNSIKVAPEVINRAITNLSLTPEEESTLIHLSTTAEHPMVAYRVASVGLDIFGKKAREHQLEETRNVVAYIEQQKEMAGGKLEETERFLQEFSNKGVPSGSDNEESGVLRKLLQLELQLAEIRGLRELSEANIAAFDGRLREIRAPAQPSMDTFSTPEVAALQRQLEALITRREQLSSQGGASLQIAEMDKRISEVRDALYQTIIKAPGNMNTNLAMEQTLADQIRQSRIKEELELYMLRNRERYFSQLLQRYRNENPRIVDRAIEEAQLKRSKSVYERLYNILLEKGEEARIRAATSLGGIRVVDAPYFPEHPISSNLFRKFCVAMMLGLGLGFGLAFMKEYLDNTIRSSDELARKTGMAVIGAVPVIGEGKNRKIKAKTASSMPVPADTNDEYVGHLIHKLPPRDPVVDVYRSLRTNLQFASVDKPVTSLLITSSIPNEGKSLSAANLAISFAELGKRVLIVDGDLRKPKQHEIFGIPASPGLSDFMVKNLDLKQIIYPTAVSNLRLTPCGTVPPNPAEMIASRRMADFLQHMQKLFDLVVIDSPPVRVVTDPLLLGVKVTHALLVVKFASTQMRDVQETLELMRRAQINLLGMIFNSVRTGRGYNYYGKYNYYYHSDEGEKKH